MDTLKITGGARIGMANATWPLATLKVTRERLELNASIVGNLVFQPKDIISIKPYLRIPVLGQGIKINHRIANYNSKVVFWTFKDPEDLINQIKSTGFLDAIDHEISDSDEVVIKQQAGSFPIKKSVAVGIIVLWNLLFISDFINHSASGKEGSPIGIGATAAIGMLLLISLLMLISKGFSRIILKEGKSIKDVDKFLYLLIFISGFMLLMRLSFMMP